MKALRPGLTRSRETESELAVVDHWLALENQITFLKKKMADLDAALDRKAHDQYAKLSEDELKAIVIDDKWLAELERRLHAELDRVSQRLTGRLRELAERYDTPLQTLEGQVAELAARVDAHLARMGAQA